jgi:four helix bundle protein
MRDFRQLKVWERGHRLVLDIYEATGKFPRQETYGLAAQLRRSSASIPANIAEGCGRSGDAELARFMLVSMGSASELEYHLLLAHDLNFLDDRDLRTALREGKRSKTHALDLHNQAAPQQKLTS